MDLETRAGFYNLICITGIPGTGKTTLCKMLSDRGISCTGLDCIAEISGAKDDDIVDVDKLYGVHIESDIVESHYSHFLNCNHVIILVEDEKTLHARLKTRGYSDDKINENIDSQRAEIIYYEALERLPAGRIHIIHEKSRSIEDIYNDVVSIISRVKEEK